MSATSALRLAPPPRLSARGVLDRIVTLDARYRAKRQMLELDERLLRDIGVTRADIDAELRRPFGL